MARVAIAGTRRKVWLRSRGETWRRLACASVLAGVAGGARGQCTPGWQTQMGTPGAAVPVRVMTELSNGDIVAGGDFTSIGGVAAAHIARYSQSTGAWSAIGAGTNSSVHSLLVLPDGDLLVGGSFWNAGGVATWGVARVDLDTNTWSGIGSVVGTVYLLTLEPSGNVLVGGSFMGAGTATTANYIARWNPSTSLWSAIPGGSLSSTAYDACVLADGDLIVGGSFDRAGGLSALRIARYDVQTNTWSALGAGTSASVEAVTRMSSGEIVVGGGFTSAGGLTANCVARYNPSTNAWSTIPGVAGAVGMVGGAIYTQSLLPGGEVVVAGGFMSAGNVAGTSRIAIFHPETNAWTAMGTGVNDNVFDVKTLRSGDVVAGGGFTTASGGTVGRIARYGFGLAGPVVVDDPDAAVACPGDDVSFEVEATGATGYAWWKGATAIDVVANPTAATPTLILTAIDDDDAGSYSCRLGNTCHEVMSAAAGLTMREEDDPACARCAPCAADFDQDGGVTGNDLGAFIVAFEQGTSCADVDENGGVDGADLAAFFGVYEAGGC